MRGRMLRSLSVACGRNRRSYTTPANLVSKFSCPPIPVTNVTDYCFASFEKYSDLPAMVCGESGKQLSYNEVVSLSYKFGSSLLHLGLQQGDRVAVLLPNCPEYVPVMYGTMGVGMTLVPVSPLLTPTELSKILELCQPSLIVTIDPLVPAIVAAQGTKDTLLPMVTLTDSPSTTATPFNQFTDNDGSLYSSRPSMDPKTSLAILPFSSGTTGPPKGVMLSHYNMTAATALLNDIPSGCSLPPLEQGEEQKVALSVIPMFHIFGLACNSCQALTSGIKMVTLPRFEPSSFLSCLAHHKPHCLNLVPPLVAFLALNPVVKPEVHLANTFAISSGGSPLSNQVVAAMKSKLAGRWIDLREGFGLTESPIISRTPIEMDERLRGCVGHIMPGVEARVQDVDTGELVGPEVPGELLVKGPAVTLGYYNAPEATKESFQDGWFKTGDVVTYSNEGYITIVDRIKDMIKVKGFQVSPTELENVIRQVPGVLEVSVIGVPDTRLGEAPRAVVVRDPKVEKLVKEEDIQRWMDGRVANYKKLAGGVVFLTELPKSPTGKVLRKELRKLVSD